MKTIFEMKDWPDFLKAYQEDTGLSTTLLKHIWEFGNEQWEKGYEQGYRDPDFLNEEEEKE